MLILTHATLRNPAILQVRQLPRRFFNRVTPRPRAVGMGQRLRLLIELQTVRYMLALLPLVVVGLVWNGAALPLAQAPLLMLFIIWYIEMRVLRVKASKRSSLIDPAAAERGLDLLRVQGRAALTRIGAGRGLRSGMLHLVIEQSDLRGLPPLTYVSVQSEDGPQVLALTATERQVLRDQLFQPPLSEGVLHRINQSQNIFLRDIMLDARAVSAHARLAAALAQD
ncbi:hypothetical protein ACOI1H_09395 [Loktanella sp. DJP18]|uniref:hypothetical protein n=1 Tax=Loktanella sp. DJP18 TaxID=3409788 RepID=UPI003BB55B0F